MMLCDGDGDCDTLVFCDSDVLCDGVCAGVL